MSKVVAYSKIVRTIPLFYLRTVTYYMIVPIVDIMQNGGSFADVALNLAILTALIVVLIGVSAIAVRRGVYERVVIGLALLRRFGRFYQAQKECQSWRCRTT